MPDSNTSVLHLAIIQKQHYTMQQALEYYAAYSLENILSYDSSNPRNFRLHIRETRKELEMNSSLSTLAMCEAKVRLDYELRCRKRYKDAVSKAFREVYRKTGTNARWDSLLDIWKFNQSDFDDRRIVSELKSAFHFRHWLAHGRYWPQKQTFTYGQVYRIVEAFLFLAQLR